MDFPRQITEILLVMDMSVNISERSVSLRDVRHLGRFARFIERRIMRGHEQLGKTGFPRQRQRTFQTLQFARPNDFVFRLPLRISRRDPAARAGDSHRVGQRDKVIV